MLSAPHFSHAAFANRLDELVVTHAAGLAEILRGSPYARRDALGTMSSLVNANASLDAERTEFQTLFGKAKALLAP